MSAGLKITTVQTIGPHAGQQNRLFTEKIKTTVSQSVTHLKTCIQSSCDIRKDVESVRYKRNMIHKLLPLRMLFTE